MQDVLGVNALRVESIFSTINKQLIFLHPICIYIYIFFFFFFQFYKLIHVNLKGKMEQAIFSLWNRKKITLLIHCHIQTSSIHLICLFLFVCWSCKWQVFWKKNSIDSKYSMLVRVTLKIITLWKPGFSQFDSFQYYPLVYALSNVIYWMLLLLVHIVPGLYIPSTLFTLLPFLLLSLHLSA